MIHLENVNKTYFGAQPLHVLKGINLDIQEGEFVSIMGATNWLVSGSGICQKPVPRSTVTT